eukprot:5284151-Pleurochrysis_carterae.AAC.1
MDFRHCGRSACWKLFQNTTPFAWTLAALASNPPVVKVTAYKRAPDDWWIFDDSSPASGRFDSPATSLAAARGNPYE